MSGIARLRVLSLSLPVLLAGWLGVASIGSTVASETRTPQTEATNTQSPGAQPLLEWLDYATLTDEKIRKEREAFKQLACGTPTADEVPMPVYPGAVVELAFCHGGPQPCPLRTGVFPKEQLEGACGPPDTGRRFSFLHILSKDHHTKVSAWYQQQLCKDRPSAGNGPCEGWFWVTAGGPQLGMRSHDTARSVVPHLPPIWATRLGYETSIILLFK